MALWKAMVVSTFFFLLVSGNTVGSWRRHASFLLLGVMTKNQSTPVINLCINVKFYLIKDSFRKLYSLPHWALLHLKNLKTEGIFNHIRLDSG